MKKNLMTKILGTVFILTLLTGCMEDKAQHKGLFHASLFGCEKEDNGCVSSSSPENSDQWVEAINYTEPKNVAMEKLNKIILKTPGARIIRLDPDYFSAEIKTKIVFIEVIDDVEFLFQPGTTLVQIRNESRSKLPSFGRQKKFIEEVRFKYFQNDVN